ncbi:MAG TPA: hydroxymethylglutaryl-CoA lyase [Ramlibacter sp.]|uniref:hydroxymethylglutaryl-CoA lyase n=1 Tax=Ramlibacter sp. TaxID=1917967 RepID=UPI002D7F9D29|nr:hydroxymethylglutaryl-CoA lyase [Ramlibacter sp.]HET8746825.1 hydroxymethylglutaryl-CoA lyase [Ramlibacter sp.]
MAGVVITDVGPRDGLQSQQAPVSTEGKRTLIEALWAAGLPAIEATSFVSPKAVPQMADADDLLPSLRVPPGRALSALVPNRRGLERALRAGCREVAVVLSATETMNQRNIRMGLAQALDECTATLLEARSHGLATRAYVAVAFACPFEGRTPAPRVRELAQAMADAGAGELVIADTIGAASPVDVREVLDELLPVVPVERVGLHFHDTRGLALANAWQALGMGVRRFDASIGGLGGCPFAPGAAGNLATEDLAVLCTQTGHATGLDPALLVRAVDVASALVGYPVGGRAMPWLRRSAQHASAEKQEEMK